jgi:hypothetical protein
MRLHPLGARLADMERCSDGADGWRIACRYFVGELLRRSRLQRINVQYRSGLLSYRRYLRLLGLSASNDHHEQLV